jgi:hypothetical protein
LYCCPVSTDIVLDLTSRPFLNVDGQELHELAAGVRWFPAKRAGQGLWVVLNGYLIIGRKNGSVTVIPVPGDVEPVTAPEVELNPVATSVGSEGTKKPPLL